MAFGSTVCVCAHACVRVVGGGGGVIGHLSWHVWFRATPLCVCMCVCGRMSTVGCIIVGQGIVCLIH